MQFVFDRHEPGSAQQAVPRVKQIRREAAADARRPDHPAPVVRNTDHGTELVTMRWRSSVPIEQEGQHGQHEQPPSVRRFDDNRAVGARQLEGKVAESISCEPQEIFLGKPKSRDR